jgi:hypothetical protein
VRFKDNAHSTRAEPPAQDEPLGTYEFFGGLNHRKTLCILKAGSNCVDRTAIVPYMICAINNKEATKELKWTGACC